MPDLRHVACPHCAAVNRIPAEKPASAAHCGVCHQALFSGRPTAVDAATFEKHRRSSDIPILLDVWAPWCGPCRAMAPMFERAAQELEPEVRLIKLNADEEPRVSSELGVASIRRCSCSAAAAWWRRRQVQWMRRGSSHGCAPTSERLLPEPAEERGRRPLMFRLEKETVT
jgi:thioredoxin 2